MRKPFEVTLTLSKDSQYHEGSGLGLDIADKVLVLVPRAVSGR